MPTLVNNCTPFLDDPDWSSKPQVTPAFATVIAGSLGLPEDRLGLRVEPFIKQQWRLTVGSVPELNDLEGRIRAALKSGKACAPRLDRAFEVQGGGNASIGLIGSFPLAAGDWLCVSISGVWTAVQIDMVTQTLDNLWDVIQSTGHEFAGTPDVGLMAYPLIFGKLTVRNWPRLNGSVGQAELVIEEPLGTGALANSDACVPGTLEADDTFSLCSTELTVAGVPCASASACALVWEDLNQADSYRVEKATASADGPWTTVASGVTTGTYTVPRSATESRWYRVVPVIGVLDGEPSNVVFVEASGIEKVMRAVQERHYWATGGYITWPVRASDSAAPGNYPATGFYTDAVGAQAATYTASISTAFSASGWVSDFAQDGTLEGIANIAAIPVHDTTTLAVPSAGSINSGNWQSKLLELAASACQLQFLLVDSVNSAVEDWLGAASALKYVEAGDFVDGTTSLGALIGAAKGQWETAKYASDLFIRLPDSYGPASYSDVVWVGPTNIGAVAWAGTGITRSGGSYHYGWGVTYANVRGKQSVDLSTDARGSVALFLLLDTLEGFGSLAKPISGTGTLEEWSGAALTPGGVRLTPYLTGSNQLPALADGTGTLESRWNSFEGVTWEALAERTHDWFLDEAKALWTRRSEPEFAHFTYYP